MTTLKFNCIVTATLILQTSGFCRGQASFKIKPKSCITFRCYAFTCLREQILITFLFVLRSRYAKWTDQERKVSVCLSVCFVCIPSEQTGLDHIG